MIGTIDSIGRGRLTSLGKSDSSGDQGLTPHPLVMQFPAYSDEQLDELAEDLVRRGGPVTLLKRGEMLLDDVNRLRACQRAGVPVVFSEWDGTGSLAETIAKAILPRNPLSESQRAAVAVPISDQLASETTPTRHANLLRTHPSRVQQKTDKTAISEKFTETANLQFRSMSKSCDDSAPDKTVESPVKTAAAIAAKWCGVSERYVYAARALRDADRKLFDAVRLGKLNLNEAKVAVSKKLREKQLNVQHIATKRNQSDADRLIVGDAVKEMGKLIEEGGSGGKFEIIFTDPPYNLGYRYHDDPTHDAMPHAAYLSWCRRWMYQLRELMTPTGSLFVMIDWRSQADFFVMLRDLGLHPRATIIVPNPYPQNTSTNYQPSARYIHYFTRSPKTWTFNDQPLRVRSIRDAIGDTRRIHGDGVVLHDVWGAGPREWEAKGLCLGGRGVDIPAVTGNSGDRVPWDDAPPQVPELILERIVLGHSNPGDRGFDPFTGNGTFWKALRKHGRKFTGIERSPLYAEQAEKWATCGGQLGGK